jgi:futalosine hydrolase
MTVLLISATSAEIKPFLDFYRGKPDNFSHAIDVVITGIGLVAATYSLSKQVHIKRPDLIIQAGIGGCFDKNIPLGTVVAVRQETIADLGVMESGRWQNLGDLGLVRHNQFPFTRGWLQNKSETLKKIALKKVSGISINEITTSKKRIDAYREKFNPVIESMEGAALHYVALSENVPFLQIRAISNYTGERNKKKWKMKEAIINLNIELTQLLNNISTSGS